MSGSVVGGAAGEDQSGRIMRLEVALLSTLQMLDAEKAKVTAVRALLDRASALFPCSCDDAYKMRGLSAPDCAWCQDVGEFVDDLRTVLRSGDETKGE